MRKSLTLAITFLSLLAAGSARAATVYILVSPQPDLVTWVVSIETTIPIGALGIGAPETATFTIAQPNPNIAPLGAGSSFTPAATPGRFSLNLNPAVCVGINCVPFATNGTTLLGTFLMPSFTPPLEIFADDDSVGGTLFD